MTRVEFLKNVIPFNLLPEEVLIGVADLLHEVKYVKDTVIYQQELTKMKGIDIIVTLCHLSVDHTVALFA